MVKNEKVVIPKQLANVIETVRQCPSPQSEGIVLYEVLGLLNDEIIDKLPEGTMTVVKAIRHGYVVEVEFMNFNEAIKKMKEGKKVNRYVGDSLVHKKFNHSIYLSSPNKRFFYRNGESGVELVKLTMFDIESERWFVVE